MKVLVIPSTDWVGAPLEGRLNYIFERLANNHDIYIAYFKYKKFKKYTPRTTNCILCDMGGYNIEDFSMYYVLNALTHLARIREIIRRENIDVIISSNIMPSLMVNLVKGQIPIVVDYFDHFDESAAMYYHGSTIKRTVVRAVVHNIMRCNLRNADSIIVVSPHEINLMRESYGVFQKTIHAIPNGVDTRILKPLDKEQAKAALGLGNFPVIGFAGLLEYWIDLESVVQQLPAILKRVGPVRLLIVGASLYSDYTKNLKNMAHTLNVEGCLKFTGLIPFSEVNRYISAMDICLNPRKNLSMNTGAISNKVLGYLACGRPILSKHNESAEEAFRHVYAYRDEDLANKIAELLGRNIPADTIREEALNYDWNIIAEKYMQVLREAIN
jgi:glycosyltransferase involved in cell wall biosynthesis